MTGETLLSGRRQVPNSKPQRTRRGARQRLADVPLSANAPKAQGGGQERAAHASTPIGMPDAREQARTVAEFWAVELDAGDQALLNSAFERDDELREHTASVCL